MVDIVLASTKTRKRKGTTRTSFSFAEKETMVVPKSVVAYSSLNLTKEGSF
jgi:hypothetical protein